MTMGVRVGMTMAALLWMTHPRAGAGAGAGEGAEVEESLSSQTPLWGASVAWLLLLLTRKADSLMTRRRPFPWAIWVEAGAGAGAGVMAGGAGEEGMVAGAAAGEGEAATTGGGRQDCLSKATGHAPCTYIHTHSLRSPEVGKSDASAPWHVSPGVAT